MPSPKRTRKPKPLEPDANVTAFNVVQTAIGASRAPKAEKNPAAVALGRLGGKKGGKARAAKLSPERRAEIARKAANGRWHTRDS